MNTTTLQDHINRSNGLTYAMRTRMLRAVERHQGGAMEQSPAGQVLGKMVELGELLALHSDLGGNSLTVPEPAWLIGQIQRHLHHNPTL